MQTTFIRVSIGAQMIIGDMSSMLDTSQLQAAQDFTLDHLSQIKLCSMEQSNGLPSGSDISLLIPNRRVSNEESLTV